VKELVPQSRPRVYIAGFREDTTFDFAGFEIVGAASSPVLGDILLPQKEVGPEFTLSDTYHAYVERQAARNKARGNGFRTKYLGPKDVAPAIIASYGCDREFFIRQKGKNPRRLTPRECARAMGFPDWFMIPVSKTQAWRQFGNTVVRPLIEQLAQEIAPFLIESGLKSGYIEAHVRQRRTKKGLFVYISLRLAIEPDLSGSGGGKGVRLEDENRKRFPRRRRQKTQRLGDRPETVA
jgi:DNA (cytosine-5)-methyltransferase 1